MANQYSSSELIPSKVREGVAFRLKKISVKRRGAMEEEQADPRARTRAAQERLRPLATEFREAVDAAKKSGGLIQFDDGKLIELGRLRDLIDRIDWTELMPIAVRRFVAELEGLEVDGAAATVETLIENGPYDLYMEIVKAVRAELGLSVDEVQNLELRSTSTAVGDGSATPGTATSAEKPDTIISEGVPSSTDPASVSVTGTS